MWTKSLPQLRLKKRIVALYKEIFKSIKRIFIKAVLTKKHFNFELNLNNYSNMALNWLKPQYRLTIVSIFRQ